MFLIDDILLMPARGLLTVFRELDNAAQQELANEGEAIRTGLSELYMMLETGRITEVEFERQEKELLDRLDEFEARGGASAEEEEADEDAEDWEADEEIETEAEDGEDLEAGVEVGA